MKRHAPLARRRRAFTVALALALCLLAAGLASADPAVSIVFVVDESGSIDAGEFELEQRGYRDAVSILPADGSIEIGVVYFASGVRVAHGLVPLTPTTRAGLLAALSVAQQPGSTNMSAGIDTAAQLLAASAAGKRILCLSTDGAPDSQSAAAAAAGAARAAGLDVSPVGIGLGAAGETFLNSIASQAPIANPATFGEFAIVIVNKVGAGVGAALNIALHPDPVDFGDFPADLASSASCGGELTARLSNRSDSSATVLGLQIVGGDAQHFALQEVGGAAPSFPFQLPPRLTIPVRLSFEPLALAADQSYDASLEILAINDRTATPQVVAVPLHAAVDPQLEDCLALEVFDAAPLVAGLDAGGVPVTSGGVDVDEGIVAAAADHLVPRLGVVADGNALLLLRAVTTGSATQLRFEIDDPGTGAELFLLETSQSGAGALALEVPVEDLPDGQRQATVLLRAPDWFHGDAQAPSLDLGVRVCVPDVADCADGGVARKLEVRRAPVVLIHGLWSDPEVWEDRYPLLSPIPPSLHPIFRSGMLPYLENAHFPTGTIEYDGNEGPSVTMMPEQTKLSEKIASLCAEMRASGLACTRADLVVHSLGGLVARRFVHDNAHFAGADDFGQGSVRRILGLGTPYEGSPLAGFLSFRGPSDCLGDDGRVGLLIARDFLAALGQRVESAIDDLSPGSRLLQVLRNPSRARPTRAVYGDVGRRFVLHDGLDWIAPELAGQVIELFTNCTYDDIMAEASDGIVPISSATAGAFPAVLIDDEDGEGLSHTELPGAKEVIEAAALVLIGPQSPNFAAASTLPGPRRRTAPAAAPWPGPLDLPQPQVLPLQLQVSESVPQPGGTVTFEVVSPPAGLAEVALTDGDETFLLDSDGTPFQWQVDLSPQASGTRLFWAIGLVDRALYRSNDVELTVVPDLAALRQLDFEPNDPLVLFSGEEQRLRVSGLFADGLRRNLTQGAVGSVYSERLVDGLAVSEGDSPVLEVGADGLLVARRPGTADVVVTLGGRSTVRRVTVRPVSANDSDGDGLDDAAELALGSDPFAPDSDGDGSPDGEEAGPDPSRPSDGDGDGVPDLLDPTIRTVADAAGLPVSVSTSAGRICRLFGRSPEDFPERPPQLADAVLPAGLFDFSICDLEPGASVDVTLRFAALAEAPDHYLKLVGETWIAFPSVTLLPGRVVLHLTDGGEGDSDPTPGVIRDPGGPAFVEGLGVLEIPTLSTWGLILLALGILLAGSKLLAGRGSVA